MREATASSRPRHSKSCSSILKKEAKQLGFALLLVIDSLKTVTHRHLVSAVSSVVVPSSIGSVVVLRSLPRDIVTHS